jgi:LytR cell envelope-related transcriptional attenuator
VQERKSMEEAPLEAIPSLAPQKRQINKRFIYLVLVVIVLLLSFFAYKIFGTKNKETLSQTAEVITSVPTETPIPTPTLIPPSPTPTVNPIDKATGLDRSKLSVTVENGSGESGVAGKAKDFLIGSGYDVSSTGNADNFNYSGVTIQTKAFDSDYLSLLQKDLGFSYSIASASSDLSDGFSTDALVIIGK